MSDWHGSRQRTERRSGTCGRRGCPSSGSRSILGGRTRLSGGSSRTMAEPDRVHVSALIYRLSLEEREEISRGLAAGRSMREIAIRLRRSPLTVCREVNANGGSAKYRARMPTVVLPARRSDPSGPSSPSAGGCVEPSSASSRLVGHRSRSPRGWLRPIPRIRRCRCPTRPSTSRSSSRAVARSAKRAAFVPADRSGHAHSQGLHQRRRGPGPARQHGDDLGTSGRWPTGPCPVTGRGTSSSARR